MCANTRSSFLMSLPALGPSRLPFFLAWSMSSKLLASLVSPSCYPLLVACPLSSITPPLLLVPYRYYSISICLIVTPFGSHLLLPEPGPFCHDLILVLPCYKLLHIAGPTWPQTDLGLPCPELSWIFCVDMQPGSFPSFAPCVIRRSSNPLPNMYPQVYHIYTSVHWIVHT